MLRFTRPILSLMLTMILALLMSACGNSNGSSPDGVSGSMSFWMYQGSPTASATMQQLKARFQSTHPGATVNITYIPKDNYIPKVTTAIATNTQPDAAYVDQPLIARYAEDDVLDAVPEGLVKFDGYFQGALNTNRVNGKYYGLPMSQTCVALYYNKDLVSTPPTSWDEFLSISKQVYNPGKQIAAVGFPRSGDYAGWIFPGFVAQAGGVMLDEEKKVVTFAQQPGIDALTLWQQLAKYSPTSITDSQNSFATGHVAMLISGPWETPNFRSNFPDFKWGVVSLPKNKAMGTNIGGEDAAVFKNAKNKKLAWEWLKFLSTGDVNTTFNDKVTGNFPITSDVRDPNNPWVKADPVRQVFLDQLKYAQPRPTVADWLKINDEIVGKAIENAVVKGEDPAKSLQEGAEKARQLLHW